MKVILIKLPNAGKFTLGKVYEVRGQRSSCNTYLVTDDEGTGYYVNQDYFDNVKSDNRKFKFVGDASDYNWDFKLENGKVYDGDAIAFTDRTIGSLYDSSKDGEGLADWEIVVDGLDISDNRLTNDNTFKSIPPIDPYLVWLGESISLLDSFGADSVEFKAARVVYEYYLREVKKS